jgi:hypothetical protein
MSQPDPHPAPAVLTPSAPAPLAASAAPVNGAAGHPAPDAAAQVMLRFQDVMARFLETQRSVMLSFLGTAPAPQPLPGAPPANGYAAPVPAPAAVRPAAPPAPAVNGNGHAAATPPAAAAWSSAVTNAVGPS